MQIRTSPEVTLSRKGFCVLFRTCLPQSLYYLLAKEDSRCTMLLFLYPSSFLGIQLLSICHSFTASHYCCDLIIPITKSIYLPECTPTFFALFPLLLDGFLMCFSRTFTSTCATDPVLCSPALRYCLSSSSISYIHYQYQSHPLFDYSQNNTFIFLSSNKKF